jgi:hypothetical protein
MTAPDKAFSAAHLDWADSRPGGHHRQPPEASAVRLPPPSLCYRDYLVRRQLSSAGRWRKRRDPGAGYSMFWVVLALLGLLECWALVMVTP